QQGVTEDLAGSGAWYLESDVLRYDPNKDTERLLWASGFETFEGHFAGQRLLYFGGQASMPPYSGPPVTTPSPAPSSELPGATPTQGPFSAPAVANPSPQPARPVGPALELASALI